MAVRPEGGTECVEAAEAPSEDAAGVVALPEVLWSSLQRPWHGI